MVPVGFPRSAVLALSCLAFFSGAPAWSVRASDEVLPFETKAYLHIAHLKEFDRKWRASQLGQLYHDEQMKRFIEEVKQYLDTTWMNTSRRLGFSYDELKTTATGHVTWAMIQAEETVEAYVLMVDVSGDVEGARALIAQAARRLQQRGAHRQVHQLETTEVIECHMGNAVGASRTLFFIKDTTLCIATDIRVVEQLLANWAGPTRTSFVDLEAYSAIKNTYAAQVGGEKPDMHWFVDPLGVMELLHKPDPLELEATNPIERSRRLGVDGVRGVGGCLSFGREECDVLASLVMYAPPPRRKVLGLFSLIGGTDFRPNDWLPDDSNMVTTVYWDLAEAFEHFGPVFDVYAADGIEGTFDDILSDLKSEDGPGIDVRNNLISHLGPRVTVINHAKRAVSETSEASLVACEIREGREAAVALAVKKLLRDDPGVRRFRVPGHDNDLWLVGADPSTAGNESETRRFKTVSIMVAHNHVMISSSADLLRYMLRRPGSFHTLVDATDVQDADRQLTRLLGGDVAVKLISRTNRDFYSVYELVRMGRADRIESIYGLVVRSVLERFRDPETGALRIDFSKLPDFSDIERHFGLVGITGRSEENGWLFMGAVFPVAP